MNLPIDRALAPAGASAQPFTSFACDVIGDIHGHFGKLQALMRELGYRRHGDGWAAPVGRQAVFVGDLIDRGPEQVEVFRAVRSMVDAGHARCVMGNHELNAIAFVTPRRDAAGRPIEGDFLRQHSPGKVAQHAEFLAQVTMGSALHREMLDWFRTLPLTLDLGGIRVVHAWWHQPYVDLVASRWEGGPLPEDFLHEAHDKGSAASIAVEGLSKGHELRLPEGVSFPDHAGQQRHEARLRWWHESPRHLGDVAILEGEQQHDLSAHPVPDGYLGQPVTGAPVFVGHYWMKGRPAPLTRKVACLDWSAAKDGPLVAYRWDGEQEIDPKRFVAAG